MPLPSGRERGRGLEAPAVAVTAVAVAVTEAEAFAVAVAVTEAEAFAVAVAAAEVEAEYTDVMTDDDGTGTVFYSLACTSPRKLLPTRTCQSTSIGEVGAGGHCRGPGRLAGALSRSSHGTPDSRDLS